MTPQNNNEPITELKVPVKFGLKEVLYKYFVYLPLFILILAISLTIAYLYVRYKVPVFNSSLSLLIRNDSKSEGTSDAVLEGLGMYNKRANLANESEVLKSETLMERVVDSLGIQIQYFGQGNVRRSEIYGEVPFRLSIIKLFDSSKTFVLELHFDKNNNFQLNDDQNNWIRSGAIFKNINGQFKIDIVNPLELKLNERYFIVKKTKAEVVSELAHSLSVTQLSREASILTLAINTEISRKGRDILNELIEVYNQKAIEDKNAVTNNTIRFVDDRLRFLTTELGSVEQGLQKFRQQNQVINIDKQSDIGFKDMSSIQDKLNEQEVNLKMISFVKDYITNPINSYNLVPSNLGIEDPALLILIKEYNQLQLERNEKLKTINEAHTIIQVLNGQIEKVRMSIIDNLNNISASGRSVRDRTLAEYNSIKSSIKNIPGQEKELLEIMRQQGIKEKLFLFLLQKREETSITKASSVANGNKIDSAASSLIPISPNKSNAYKIAIIIGLLIPIIIVYIRDILNDKITTRSDITNITKIPILGEVAHHDKETRELVVTGNDRSILAEQFRIIRTNLQFLVRDTDSPVLLVTSSLSGEGKTFSSLNIGAVWALTRKRTVVLELDLRKPKITQALNLKGHKGITDYIVGTANVEDIPIPVKGMENLFVVPAGLIPPNPSELLLDSKMESLFAYLKQNFDLIIIDSAPIGIVTDAKILSRFAVATLYVVRQRYTVKKQLEYIDELFKSNVFPSLGMLVNDVKTGGLSSYYGYSKKLAYGYGHGYGYGYEEDNGKISWWKKVFPIF